MKSWVGKDVCAECAGMLAASINIGFKTKGRCHRCHSEQELFNVIAMSPSPISAQNVCPECGHAGEAHAASCQRSEVALLRTERQQLVELLQEIGGYNADLSLADQIRQLLKKNI
ncbi:MAG: hypothetical protein K0A94_11140 [Desulfuromonadales bacterium]|nr:hypothetical protein [Desulfuromonadales bacterium]